MEIFFTDSFGKIQKFHFTPHIFMFLNLFFKDLCIGVEQDLKLLWQSAVLLLQT